MRGFRITLAQPERSRDFQRDPSRVTDLVQRGILLQVNAETLLGHRRRSATCRLGVKLCAEGLVHALASDGHRGPVTWRPVTRLPEGVQAAAALIGPDRAQWLAAAAPAAIINGTELPEAPPIGAQRRKGHLPGRPCGYGRPERPIGRDYRAAISSDGGAVGSSTAVSPVTSSVGRGPETATQRRRDLVRGGGRRSRAGDLAPERSGRPCWPRSGPLDPRDQLSPSGLS
ncbi:MAG: CpsB/CapC family capsule biosynthesis tyrosine phosphatase [Solirubrobacteraceae bacterium]